MIGMKWRTECVEKQQKGRTERNGNVCKKVNVEMEAIKDNLISESVTCSTIVYSVVSPVLFFGGDLPKKFQFHTLCQIAKHLTVSLIKPL